MPNSKIKQFVVLQPEYARRLNETHWLNHYLNPSGYFRSYNVETGGNYLSMVIEPEGEGRAHIEIQIPHSAVLCILTNPKDKSLGFHIPEISDKNDEHKS